MMKKPTNRLFGIIANVKLFLFFFQYFIANLKRMGDPLNRFFDFLSFISNHFGK